MKTRQRRPVRPEAEDRGAQAADLRRREPLRRRIPAGDEGLKPNPDVHSVEETLSEDE